MGGGRSKGASTTLLLPLMMVVVMMMMMMMMMMVSLWIGVCIVTASGGTLYRRTRGGALGRGKEEA